MTIADVIIGNPSGKRRFRDPVSSKNETVVFFGGRGTIPTIMHELSQDASLYRVTLFFGPEPVAGENITQVCVFNVKKRSWKAGIQVAVEIRIDQLSALRRAIQLDDRLEKNLATLGANDRFHYEERIPDLFAQAVCWCKLNLLLQAGLGQENQRVGPDELTNELPRAVTDRSERIVTYILEELDLVLNQL